MPQIIEFQSVYWGLLPVEPVVLMPQRICALVGANGSNKSTMMDGIKLLFGLTSFRLGGTGAGERTAYDYVFRPPDTEGKPRGEPMEFALVKGVFANPDRPGAGRPFAIAGNGCDRSEYVTVVARVRAADVRWLVLDGHRQWGAAGRDWQADVQLMLDAPSSRWFSGAQYRGILRRADVSNALIEVLRLGQGQASEALLGDERDVLRHVVQMLGQQQALDAFSAAVAEHRTLRSDLEREEAELDTARAEHGRLRELAKSHERFRQCERDLTRLKRTDLPAALDAEIRRRHEFVADLDEQLQTLEVNIPALSDQISAGGKRVGRLRERRQQIASEIRVASDAAAEARHAATAARTAITAFPDASQADVERARRAAAQLTAVLNEADAELRDQVAELEALRAGGLRRPVALANLVAKLESRGVTAVVLAEIAEVAEGQAAMAEARLGDAVWSIGVPTELFEVAEACSAELGATCPIVKVDATDLRPADGPVRTHPRFDEFIREIGGMAPTITVNEHGVLRGDTFSWARAHDPPRLGEVARRRRAAQLEAEIPRQRSLVERLGLEAASAAARTVALAAAAVALARLPDLEATETDTAAGYRALQDELETNIEEQERLATSLARATGELEQSRKRLSEIAPQAADARSRMAALVAERADLADSRIAGPGPARPLAEVRQDLSALDAERRTLVDVGVHDETLPIQHERQRQRVAELEQLVGDGVKRIDGLNDQVTEARRLFNERVRQYIPRLSKHFSELCEQTDMRGRLGLTEYEEGDFGLEVDVRGTGGHHTVGLRSTRLSGGQRAKAALILLLACMSFEASTDILVSDEPGAHMDAYNLRGVGVAMSRLADRVQVIISAPLDGEAEQLDWSAHQISFIPTRPGDEDYPFVRLAIMSAEPAATEPAPDRGFDAL